MNTDDLVTCPYNKYHQIKPSRIQYHLIKCKKVNLYDPNFPVKPHLIFLTFQQHPDKNYTVCPYNASHHFPRDQIRDHLLECRDRRIAEMQKYNDPLPGRHGCLSNPPFYGSTLLAAQMRETERNIPLDDTVSSISTIDRHHALRDMIEVRQKRSDPSPVQDLSDSFSNISFGRQSRAGSEYRQLRRPLAVEKPGYGQVPPSPSRVRSRRTSPSPVEMSRNAAARRPSPMNSTISTQDGRTGLNHMTSSRRSSPSLTGLIRTGTRRTSPSPVGKRMTLPPPRKRSNSPSGSSTYLSYRN